MEKIVNFRIKNTLTPLYGFNLLYFWGDYESLSNAVLDELGIDFLDNPLNLSMRELNSRGDIEIEIEDDNADFDHETLEKFMDSSKNIDKSLAEVFLHWCIETDRSVSSWRDFLKCYEGTYSSVEKFAENIIEQRMWFGDLKLPEYILDSIDYTKVWEKLKKEYIIYLDKNVHIIRKNP